MLGALINLIENACDATRQRAKLESSSHTDVSQADASQANSWQDHAVQTNAEYLGEREGHSGDISDDIPGDIQKTSQLKLILMLVMI